MLTGDSKDFFALVIRCVAIASQHAIATVSAALRDVEFKHQSLTIIQNWGATCLLLRAV